MHYMVLVVGIVDGLVGKSGGFLKRIAYEMGTGNILFL